MTVKLFGALFVFAACTWTGLAAAGGYAHRVHCLEQLDRCLDLMQCQIEYRYTDLPELCEILDRASSGVIREIFSQLGKDLKNAVCGDVKAAMNQILDSAEELPDECKCILARLGEQLGQSDKTGEMRALKEAQEETRALHERESKDLRNRQRGCRTLGMCCGAAIIVILL